MTTTCSQARHDDVYSSPSTCHMNNVPDLPWRDKKDTPPSRLIGAALLFSLFSAMQSKHKLCIIQICYLTRLWCMLDEVEVFWKQNCSFYLQHRRMIFRRPKSYSITLQRAHSLLKIPREPSSTISGSSSSSTSISREQIQHAFRAAAKLHHPDLLRGGGSAVLGSSTAKISKQQLQHHHN